MPLVVSQLYFRKTNPFNPNCNVICAYTDQKFDEFYRAILINSIPEFSDDGHFFINPISSIVNPYKDIKIIWNHLRMDEITEWIESCRRRVRLYVDMENLATRNAESRANGTGDR